MRAGNRFREFLLLQLDHVFGCYKLALLFEIMLDYITIFALKSFEYIECSGNV